MGLGSPLRVMKLKRDRRCLCDMECTRCHWIAHFIKLLILGYAFDRPQQSTLKTVVAAVSPLTCGSCLPPLTQGVATSSAHNFRSWLSPTADLKPWLAPARPQAAASQP